MVKIQSSQSLLRDITEALSPVSCVQETIYSGHWANLPVIGPSEIAPDSGITINPLVEIKLEK